jgi:site-specific DNA-methyltransferase (adenine-specific)
MRWLVRVLATPTGGSVLDPFGGSGSTGIACMAEGRTVTMCERSPEYYEIMRYRMAHWEDELSTAPRHVKGKENDFADMPLFQERI